MKKHLLIGIILFANLNMYAQKCGAHIDLLGIGMHKEHTGTIYLDELEDLDLQDVDYILAEAVYKSEQTPVVVEINKNKKASVWFYTGDAKDPVQEAYVLPGKPMDFSGDNPNREIYVFRAKFDKPAKSVTLDILKNATDFYSFAIYVYRKDGSVYTVKAGELVHVFHNEEKPQEIVIDIPASDSPRDISFRFGITELNKEDGRLAIFTFWSNGVPETTTLESYDPDLGESYIIPEVLLENVPENIDKITLTMLSKDVNPDDKSLKRGGDSFIAGVVLADFPCEEYESELLCSFTQGFYGNEGGKACGKKTTRELLEELLSDELVMGVRGDQSDPGNSFTINKGDVDCVLDLLPGGGPSKVLVGHLFCDDTDQYETNKQGRLKNTLLSQGITLTLNTRLSPMLLSFPVDGEEFVTMAAIDCANPNAGGIPGTEMTHAFSQEIVDELVPDATIEGLLNLVNRALGGDDDISVSLSQIADAAALVNEAFDECVVVQGYAEIQPVEENSGVEGDQEEVEEEESYAKKGMTGVSNNEEIELGIYPNPVADHFYLDLPAGVEGVKQVSIYSLTGVKMMDIEQSIQQGSNQVIEINVSHLNAGVYFVRVEMAIGSLTKRFGIQ